MNNYKITYLEKVSNYYWKLKTDIISTPTIKDAITHAKCVFMSARDITPIQIISIDYA